MNTLLGQPTFDIELVKAREKSTRDSGDFGQVAKFIMPIAEEFMARIDPRPGTKVLDAACGTGNLGVWPPDAVASRKHRDQRLFLNAAAESKAIDVRASRGVCQTTKQLNWIN